MLQFLKADGVSVSLEHTVSRISIRILWGPWAWSNNTNINTLKYSQVTDVHRLEDVLKLI